MADTCSKCIYFIMTVRGEDGRETVSPTCRRGELQDVTDKGARAQSCDMFVDGVKIRRRLALNRNMLEYLHLCGKSCSATYRAMEKLAEKIRFDEFTLGTDQRKVLTREQLRVG